ncbi:MAG: excinuclease ABC subunit UvrC [Firmicutes bacterium]|nr:excinuclease ABC subunit UvrC [Bacillota bacterium]
MVGEAELRLLPAKPGVYLMRDAGGEVLYIGKARSLRHRVRSYFQESGPVDPRLRAMVGQIERLEFIVTDSEVEALALEANLVKEHRPKYNVKLRDDKQYPLLKITWNEEYPQLAVVRRIKDDGARYFGPYTDAGALRETIRLLRRLFPLRTCKHRIGVDRVARPCLNHDIGRCLAPCVGAVDKETYRAMIEQVCLFLEGRPEPLARDLRRQMEEAAARLDFERAAVLRDRLMDLSKVMERQKVVSPAGEDLDVLGLAVAAGEALVQVFRVRGGKLIDREHFLLAGEAEPDLAGSLAAFLTQYYAEAPRIPPEILLPAPIEEQEAVAAWLAQRRGGKVVLAVPRRGAKKDLVTMAMENAALLLEQERVRRSYDEGRVLQALAGLTEVLGLSAPPRRMEAFDISNLHGQEAVASMAVFLDGRPAPDEYRRFRIRTVEGPNDFAMLAEAVGRRFRRGLAERTEGKVGRGFADLPDLLLIDGGKGQLHAVLDELAKIQGLVPPFTLALAKEEEEIYLPGRSEPLVLPHDAPALHLLQRLRDEVHRFAVTYHRSIRAKGTRRSLLDEIPGIGPRRKQALLRHFGSVRRIMAASLEELAAVEGMTRAAAEAVYFGLRGAETGLESGDRD